MMDLATAIVVMAALAAVVSWMVARGLRPRAVESHPRLPSLLLTLFVFLALGLLFGTKDRLYWAELIPSSAAIIYANFSVLALAAAAGAAYRLPRRPTWRRVFESGALFVLAIAALLQPVLQPVFRPAIGADHWSPGGVCLQSQPANCSAAAGATLLYAHGIRVSEREMVEYCLTDSWGTPSLGLWRGLCLTTEEVGLAPRVLDTTLEDLVTKGPWPALLFVGLPPSGADPVYEEKYGWVPGFRHSVVMFGIRPDGMIAVGDPAVGREIWTQEDLKVLWRGEAIALAD